MNSGDLLRGLSWLVVGFFSALGLMGTLLAGAFQPAIAFGACFVAAFAALIRRTS